MRTRALLRFLVALDLGLGLPSAGWPAACVPPAISLPATLSLVAGQTALLTVQLGVAAPSGGVVVAFTSSDPTKLTVSPASLTLPAGSTGSQTAVTVTGMSAGTAKIAASAAGYTPGSTTITVAPAQSGLILLPATLTVILGAGIPLPITLSSPAPAAGLTVNLANSDPLTVGMVKNVVVFGANATKPTAPPIVYGSAVGNGTVTASAAGWTPAQMAVTIAPPTNVTVTWGPACLTYTTIYNVTGHFQGIPYNLQSPQPMTLHATLFFNANCDPVNGRDNMNDFGTLTYPGGGIQGFSHHPDEFPTSAEYWFGPRTADGHCYPGSPCSGCVKYTATSPSCN